MQYDYGHLVGYHGMSYIKSNLPKVAIWRSNGFRISPHIAKKSTTLLFSGTFGHTVCCEGLWYSYILCTALVKLLEVNHATLYQQFCTMM